MPFPQLHFTITLPIPMNIKVTTGQDFTSRQYYNDQPVLKTEFSFLHFSLTVEIANSLII